MVRDQYTTEMVLDSNLDGGAVPAETVKALEPRQIGFRKGVAQPGSGRKPGVPLKSQMSGAATAARMGFDVVEVMIKWVRDGVLMNGDGTETPVSLESRERILREVAPYIVSKAPTAVVAKHDHTHTHVDMTRIMLDPILAEAAERLALAMAAEPDREALVFDADFEDVSDEK